jgi:hypothetical protein
MIDDPNATPLIDAPEIRITRLNAEKTRKDTGSDTVYHVYFELSGHPAPEWIDIFAREWEGVGVGHAANVDGEFLVLHCQLNEVGATLVPALKKAVTATNAAYKLYSQKETAALEHREDAWKQERKNVETMASTVRFD